MKLEIGNHESRIPIIVGPTAVGKSAVAVAVAQDLHGEVIGLDSRQIYRHMAIGTAQPTEKEKRGIPHHLYGILGPDRSISAGEYARLVENKVDELLRRSSLPIICGGSGLYFRALTRGLFDGSSTNRKIREGLQKELSQKGATVLLQRLQEIDPDYAKIVHPNNHKRLLRALEIHAITGLSPSEHFKRQREKPAQRSFFVAYLRASLDFIAERICKRTKKMLESGWVEEVQSLLEMGVPKDAHPMDSVGYVQITEHLQGRLEYEEMVELINLRARQYAKKQLTWFNSEPADVELDVTYESTVAYLSRRIVEAFKSSLT